MRKKYENDLLYVQHQIEWIKSIHEHDERTQYHLIPDVDVKRMKRDERYLNANTQFSEDKKNAGAAA